MNFNKFSLKTRPEKLRNILIILVIFIAVLTGFLFLINNLNTSDSNMEFHERFEILSDGWHVKTGTMDEYTSFPAWVEAEPGETVSAIIKVPKLPSSVATALVVRNYHQRLEAYLDGELVYEFPKDFNNINDSIITDDWNMMYLPEDAEGKTVEIRLMVGNGGLARYLEPVIFGEDNSIVAYLQEKYGLSHALGLVLVVIGLLLIIVSTIYSNTLSEKSHILLGAVFIAVGIWFSDRSRMPIYMVGSNMKFFAAFCVLSLTPLLLSLYAGERFKTHNQTVTNILIIGDIVLEILLFALIAAGVVPLHGVIQYVYLAILIACIYLVYLMWYYAHGNGKTRLNRVQLNSVKMEFISAVITIVGSFLSILWDAVTSNNWSTSQRDWSGVGNIQMFSVIIFAAAHFIVLVYNSYYSVLESEATQKLLHDSQLQLMMGQIQPHFMFNTLSSIRTLIKVDPEVAYEMTYDFSNYLRANVDNLTNLDGIAFAEEVEHIKNYINIEKVRFGDRLNIEMDIKESEFIVPPLSIQPLVENAIKHGVCKRPEGGTVWLRSYAKGKNYIVEVEDDGVGISPELLEMLRVGGSEALLSEDEINLTGNGSENHQSTGMKNISIRLREISHATLEMSSELGKGTMMQVIFPKDGQPKSK